MSVQTWGIVIGVAVSALLALTPWMFMVHGKLAVLSVQMTRLTDKVDKIVEADQSRLPQLIRQQATLAENTRRLQAHDVFLTDMTERLRLIEEDEAA